MNNLRHRLRFIAPIIVVVTVFALVSAACGGGGDEQRRTDANETIQSGGNGSTEPTSMISLDGESEPESDEKSASEGQITSLVSDPIAFDRLVIREAQITLTVSNVASSINLIRSMAVINGGYVLTSNTYVEDDNQFAQISIRVPGDRYDTVVADIEQSEYVVRIDREESASQDVTAEFVDNESRLKALEETERRYLALLSDADTIDQILRLENELTSIRTQIETIMGRQHYLEEMTAFSTITVTLRPELDNAPISDPEDDDSFFARIVNDSWGRAEGVLKAVLEATLSIGMIAAIFLPFAVIGWFVYRMFRRFLPVDGGEAPVEPAPKA